MLLGATRRMITVLAFVAGGTAAVSLMVGTLTGAAVSRSVSLGFYVAGSVLLLLGFFVGNRGPARVKSETPQASWVPFVGGRVMRWASRDEAEEAINLSAIFVFVGLVLLMLAVVVDSRYQLF